METKYINKDGKVIKQEIHEEEVTAEQIQGQIDQLNTAIQRLTSDKTTISNLAKK